MSHAAASILQQQEEYRRAAAVAASDAELRRKTSVQGEVDGGGSDIAYAQEDYYLLQQQDVHGRRTLGPEDYNAPQANQGIPAPQETQQHHGGHPQEYHHEYGHSFMGNGNYHGEQPQSKWNDQHQQQHHQGFGYP